MNKTRVFICGGHFTPAIAVMEMLSSNKNLELFYIGRKYSQESDKTAALEFREARKNNIRFLEITAGKLNRFLSVSTFTSLLKIPTGFIQSAVYLKRFKPKLVISFGSYVALPVCIVARLFGISVITHEQTAVMGLSNRVISFFAKYVCTTFSQTRKIPWSVKTVNTGMLFRQSVINPGDSGITGFGNRKLPLLFVTGGSQGSLAINSVIKEIAPLLLKKYRIFHICGESDNKSDYHKLSKVRQTLDKNYMHNYFLIPSLEHTLVGEVIRDSALVISRSGANTVAELMLMNKRAILIPLPIASGNEQFFNAEQMRNIGLATIILQERLKPNLLLSSIENLVAKNIKNENTENPFFKKDGLETIGKIIQSELDA